MLHHKGVGYTSSISSGTYVEPANHARTPSCYNARVVQIYKAAATVVVHHGPELVWLHAVDLLMS